VRVLTHPLTMKDEPLVHVISALHGPGKWCTMSLDKLQFVGVMGGAVVGDGDAVVG